MGKDNTMSEAEERFRKQQIVKEREKWGWHRFSMYISPVSQKKKRQMARRLGA